MEKIGVPSAVILPYDWEHQRTPEEWIPNIDPNLKNKVIRIFYAGSLSIEKGIFDIIAALPIIKENGREATIRIAGSGNVKEIEAFARSSNVLEDVCLLGRLENHAVLEEMHRADVVAVPSHHRYPEGLPMTIMESLLVQTPVIVSDHPMFVGRLLFGKSVEVVPEKCPIEIARKVLLICNDLKSYKLRCSHASTHWHYLTLKLKWATMINDWLKDEHKNSFENFTLDTFH